jgi:hypothetical protein
VTEVVDRPRDEAPRRASPRRGTSSAGAREGALRHAREFLVKLCQATGLALDESDLARIQACDDVAALDGWTLRVPGAKRAADMFR